MRFLTVAVLGVVVGCGSTHSHPYGGGGTTGSGGAGGTTGGGGAAGGGTTGTAGTTGGSGGNGSVDCVFDSTYRYGDTGGLVAYEDTATLTPPASYSYERNPRSTTPPSISCAPALPPCGVSDLWSAFDIRRGIEDADVQAALAKATPPTFGVDARGVDGTIFQFLRADGRGFLAGHVCPGGSQGAGCVDAPIGITRLVNLLRALDEQQLRDPSCAALR